MTSKSKILDFIYANLRNLESDWQKELEDMNIWNDVEDLYYVFHDEQDNKKQISLLEGNTLLAFIVLSYDNKSQFLEPHKDRFDNKVKIITRLAGPSAMVNDAYKNAVYCQDHCCNNIIDWYVNFQKDSRWKTVLANKEYASQATALAMVGPANSKDGVDMGKMLKEAEERDIAADKMLDTLRSEYLSLDTILEKEGKQKATSMDDTTNFMSHEGFITARDIRRAKEEKAQEAEEKRQKQAAKEEAKL